MYQLEQLERMRSENTPHRPMITHTIDSYQIPRKKKYGKNVSRIVDFFHGERRKIWKISEKLKF